MTEKTGKPTVSDHHEVDLLRARPRQGTSKKAKKPKHKTPFEPFESAYESDNHVRLATNMLTSKAWQDLQHGSRTIYIELKRRYQGKGQEVTCPYSSVSSLISKGGFTDAIDDLVNHGFIQVEFRGWAARKCSIYSLSPKWFKWPNIAPDPTKTRRPPKPQNRPT